MLKNQVSINIKWATISVIVSVQKLISDRKVLPLPRGFLLSMGVQDRRENEAGTRVSNSFSEPFSNSRLFEAVSFT